MKLNTIIESVSSKAYHATSYSALMSILRSDFFALKNSSRSLIKKHPVNIEKYKKYMSLARTMNSAYVISTVESGGIVIEFDGEKLSHNFKGKPVDFYGDIPYKERVERSKKMSGGIDKEEYFRYYEAEDRLYTTKERIRNIKKYIKAIHLVYRKEAENRGYYKVIKEHSKDGKAFKVYAYDTVEDLLYKRKNKTREL